MTLGEFRKLTSDMPDNIDLFVAERKTEFGFGLVNSVTLQNIPFREEPDSEDLCRIDVLVIDEE